MGSGNARLQGAYGYGIRTPFITESDIVSNYGSVFSANLKNLHAGSIVNKNKPFYGYIIDNPVSIKAEELYLFNEYLNVATYEARPDDTVTAYPVRIPYYHEATLPDPSIIADEKIRRSIINCHTLCTVDPTRVAQSFNISPGTLVKIQFTSNDYSKAYIIGIAGGTGGGLLGQIGAATVTYGGDLGSGITEGNDATNAEYLIKNCEKDLNNSKKQSTGVLEPVGEGVTQGRAIALGASMMSYGAPLWRVLKRRRVPFDVSSNHGNIANCYLKMQLGGTRFPFVEQQLQKTLKYPSEVAKYRNYEYVFINAPSANDTAMHYGNGGAGLISHARQYANNQQRIANFKQNLKTLFPNAKAMFLVKPSHSWSASDGTNVRANKQQTINYIRDSGFGNYFYVLKADVSGDHHVKESVVTEVADAIEHIVNTGEWSNLVFQWSTY